MLLIGYKHLKVSKTNRGCLIMGVELNEVQFGLV